MKETLFCMLLLAGGLTASLAQADVTRVDYKMFEGDGDVGGFTSGNTWMVTLEHSADTSYTGTASLKLNCANACNGNEWQAYQWNGGGWSGTPYLQFQFKNSSATYTAATVYLQYWNWNTGGNWTDIGSFSIPANNAKWNTITLDMASTAIPSNTGGMRFISYSLGVGTYYIDDMVFLSAIPEPASLALLGLGGLALLRRRRN